MRLLGLISRLLLIATISWLGSLHAEEGHALERIGMRIQQYQVVRADFTQTKQMTAMKRPLVTAGRLVFSRKHGVLWQIEEPFRMSYVLGEDKIVEIGSDGIRRERSLREVPGLIQVGRVFRALLGANSNALREYFEATVRGEAGRWEIDLTPRQPQLAQFLTGLHLSGSDFVDILRINEAGGDVTQIRFYNSQGATVPSAAELLLFNGEASATSPRLSKP